MLLLSTTFSISGCKEDSADKESAALLNEDPLSIPPLAERKGDLANTDEWQKTKDKVAQLKADISNHPNDVNRRLKVATIYMSEARITQNAYYYQAVWKILDGVLQLNPNNFEAYVFKASVAMSLHNFNQAKELAEKAKSIIPDNAFIYGILVDANVELGNYEEAIKMSDKMQELKPSLESYSRASYLREIYGNYPSAIDAMTLAVKAGATGLESDEWARVTLGDLYLNTGKLDIAEELYRTTLQVRPEFPNAYIGLAKVERARQNYDSAIAYTKQAIRLISESAFVSQLGELYELKGDHDKAKEVHTDVLKLVQDGEKEQQSNKTLVKHNGNRELANAYLHTGDYDKALTYATNDYKIRPNNIDANELLARIYYVKGDYANAKTHADKMFITNSKNAGMLLLASMIYAKSGDAAKAQQLAAEAKTVNPTLTEKNLLANK